MGLRAAFLSLLGACATPRQRIAATEDRLAQRGVGGDVAYLYGDPLVCGCVHVGSEQAYGRYAALTVRQPTVRLTPGPSGNW